MADTTPFGTVRLAFLGLIGVVFLSGCDLDTDVELYISDLIDVVETGEAGSTPAEIGIEMLSVDQCRDDMDEVAMLMRRYLPDFQAQQCVQRDFQAYLQAEATIAIVPGVDPEHVSGLFSIGIESGVVESDRSGHAVHFLVDRELFSRLSAEVEQQYFQEVNFADSRLTVRVNNDEREPRTVQGQYVFFDGTPVEQGQLQLQRRERTRIQVSDVARGALMAHGSTRLMVLGFIEE